MPLKIYFLTSEIIPFAETSQLAHFSKHVPIKIQEHGSDIRLTAPKYGFISERKYILREVIRLREIVCEFDDQIILASAKSAFIPQTRVQVYFVEHPEWFQPLNPLLYKSRNGRPFPDNDDRFGFFGKIALNMLTHLYWRPDIILCNSWQSAFVPILYKSLYTKKNFYKDIKIVQAIHSFEPYSKVSKETYKKLGVGLPDYLNVDGEFVNSLVVACEFADLILLVDDSEKNLLKELSHLSDFRNTYPGFKDKLTSITISDNSPNEYNNAADRIVELLEDNFV